jgi:hypothetical protein
MQKTPLDPQREEGQAPSAVRLTFSYKGERLKLVKQQILRMTPPPSDELKETKEASGFWVEVRDAKHKVLYRRAMQSPVRRYAEVRADDPDMPLAMQEVKDPSGIFTILIPHIDKAVEVALFSSPSEEKKRLLPATEIGRYNLRGGKKGREA